MKTQLECLPCFIRQASDALQMATEDEAIQEKVLRQVIAEVSRMEMSACPPLMGQQIHRWVREFSGNPDPYRSAKKQCNDLAEALLPQLRERLANTDQPLEMTLRLAMAGNIIDFGVNHGFSLDNVAPMLEEALCAPLDPDLLKRFKADLQRAERILFLADNTGEIFLDRLLVEQLPMEKITLAVRGGPIINDALLEDAERAGLTDLVTVIDNGSDSPGTLLNDCCESFRDTFRRADMIIAKGQGNYESLHDVPHNIYFLLKAKCPVSAGMAGVNIGAYIFTRTQIEHYANSARCL